MKLKAKHDVYEQNWTKTTTLRLPRAVCKGEENVDKVECLWGSMWPLPPSGSESQD